MNKRALLLGGVVLGGVLLGSLTRSNDETDSDSEPTFNINPTFQINGDEINPNENGTSPTDQTDTDADESTGSEDNVNDAPAEVETVDDNPGQEDGDE